MHQLDALWKQEIDEEDLDGKIFANQEEKSRRMRKILQDLIKIRMFSNIQVTILKEKYVQQINTINENNSSNDKILQEKLDMMKDYENMKDQIIMLKKNMT